MSISAECDFVGATSIHSPLAVERRQCEDGHPATRKHGHSKDVVFLFCKQLARELSSGFRENDARLQRSGNRPASLVRRVSCENLGSTNRFARRTSRKRVARS